MSLLDQLDRVRAVLAVEPFSDLPAAGVAVTADDVIVLVRDQADVERWAEQFGGEHRAVQVGTGQWMDRTTGRICLLAENTIVAVTVQSQARPALAWEGGAAS